MDIPPEIAHEIVAHLSSDLPSLRNTSLVSNVFRNPCQDILFAQISLPPHTVDCNYISEECITNHDRQIEVLLEAFNKNSRLPSKVRILNICDSKGYRLPWAKWGRTGVFEVIEMIHHENIEHLSIQLSNMYLTAENALWKWGSFSEGVEALLVKCLQSTSLTSLHLDSVPIELIKCCQSHIKHLRLLNTCQFHESFFKNLSAVTYPPQLQTLSIADSMYLPKTLDALRLLNVDYSSLQILRFDLSSSEEIGPLMDVLNDSAESLHTLAIKIPGTFGSGSGLQLIDLSKTPRLRNLTIKGEEWRVLIFYLASNHTLQIWSMFETIPPSSSLEEVTLDLSYSSPRCRDVTEEEFLGTWRRIARILCDRLQCPNLRKVTLIYGYGHYQKGVFGVFDELFTLDSYLESPPGAEARLYVPNEK